VSFVGGPETKEKRTALVSQKLHILSGAAVLHTKNGALSSNKFHFWPITERKALQAVEIIIECMKQLGGARSSEWIAEHHQQKMYTNNSQVGAENLPCPVIFNNDSGIERRDAG
jgi:hypothetical protein